MSNPRIYADFNNADSQGRLRLNCAGTMEDLAAQKVELREGLVLTLYTDDLDDEGRADELMGDGVVSYSVEERCWVATVGWNKLRHASQRETPYANGADSNPELPAVGSKP